MDTPVKDSLGHSTQSLRSRRNRNIGAFEPNPVNGRDKRGSSGAVDLAESASLLGGNNLSHADVSLRDGDLVRKAGKLGDARSMVPEEGKDRVAGDSGENDVCGEGRVCQEADKTTKRGRKRALTLKRRRDDLDAAVGLFENNKEVHGADLSEEFLLADEPEVLAVAHVGGLHLGDNAGSVVGSKLVPSSAAGSGARVVRGGEEGNRLEAG